MWGSVLGLALIAALHPFRLAIILLMVSRPRPVQNLLAYWVGSLAVGVPALLVPLMVLHFTPMFRPFAQGLGTPATGPSTTFRHIQIGMGVLVLSVAALMTLRYSARQRARLPTPHGNTSTLMLDSNTPTAISPLPGRAQDAPREGGSAIRRLLGRARNAWGSLWLAWENGSLWVALVLGVITAPADGILFMLAILAGSGATFGTQVSAAIAFVVGWLAVVEIILVTCLAAPAKTQAALGLLHDFAQAHSRKMLVGTLTVVGLLGVARGMAII